MDRFIFPEWTVTLQKWIRVLVLGAPIYLITLIHFGVSAEAIRIGYQPTQPVPYSHALHVGEMGMDCRYCHNTVERSAKAAVPPAATCMNCHKSLHTTSPRLEPVRDSFENDTPLKWVRVHDLPDYVFFNHSAHVTRGVGCESCHGRIDLMGEVYQAKPLTMMWCLDCHRAPEKHLRPVEEVTTMGYQPVDGDQLTVGERLRKEKDINPSTDCSTCHR
jgi:hypothetical protein